MKRRRLFVFFLAATLACAAGGAPRHAHAGLQSNDHAAITHDHPGSEHAHAVMGGVFAEGSAHDHAGAAPLDSKCCYAWCHSVAIAQTDDWVFEPKLPDTPALPQARPLIAVFASAIDPPPR